MNLLNNVTNLNNLVHEMSEGTLKERLFKELKDLSEDIKAKESQQVNGLKELIQQIGN